MASLLGGGQWAIGAGAFALWFLVMSIVAYSVFAADKRAAVLRERRTPEATLLLLAVLGGWPGAKVAQHRLRHKTRKEPFRTRLNAAAVLCIGLVLALTAILNLPLGTGMQGQGDELVSALSPPPAVQKTVPRRFGPGSETSSRHRIRP